MGFYRQVQMGTIDVRTKTPRGHHVVKTTT